MKLKISIVILIIIGFYYGRSSKYQKIAYYFYFESGEKMIKYYSSKDGPLNYMYVLDIDNVFFTPKQSKNRIEIYSKDTTGMDLKGIEWLNKLTRSERYDLLLKKSDKNFYIVEKDSTNGKLFAYEVISFQEID